MIMPLGPRNPCRSASFEKLRLVVLGVRSGLACGAVRRRARPSLRFLQSFSTEALANDGPVTASRWLPGLLALWRDRLCPAPVLLACAAIWAVASRSFQV